MAELTREGDELVLILSAFEEAEALHGDLRVPIESVQSVEVVDDVIHAVHGIKLPGTRWPGKVAVGTFYGGPGSRRSFVVVHHDTPRGLRVRLDEGAAYGELIIGCEDPEAAKRAICERP
jgi:hypothetical protein